VSEQELQAAVTKAVGDLAMAMERLEDAYPGGSRLITYGIGPRSDGVWVEMHWPEYD